MNQEISFELTRLISEWQQGDQDAYNQLFSLLYPYLHQIARRKLIGEGYASGYQTTELVQEIFLSLMDKDQLSYENRRHFLNLAGVVMHRLLVDLARKRKTQRRGGNMIHVDLEDQDISAQVDSETILAIDEVLEQLQKSDPQMARIVQLRFSAGYSIKEIAEILDQPERTVYRKWRFGKSWLIRQLKLENPEEPMGDH